MIVAEKPELDDALLAHFGIRGMKWGIRRDRESSGSSGPSKPMSTKKKVAIGVATGVAIAGGAVAVAYMLKGRGDVRLPRVTSAKPLVGQSRPLSGLPSPFEMRMQAGMAAQRNVINRAGTQRLTDKAWRDSARLSRLTRDMDKTTSNLMRGTDDNMAALQRALLDPNHTWQL